MNAVHIVLLTWLLFSLLYVLAVAIKNASIVDIAWGLSFMIIAVSQQLSHGHLSGTVLTVMVLVWGARLSWHIGRRNIGKPEDFRYANWRREWGQSYLLRSYLQIFMLQGFMMLTISLAHLTGMTRSAEPVSLLAIIGLCVYAAGISLEAEADASLKRHLANPQNRGKLLRSGVWQHSRHPNYFGEALLWWGIYLVALAYGAPWWTFISPLTITVLVRYVSGVPMLEKGMEKYADFADYCATTSIFIPWFPNRR